MNDELRQRILREYDESMQLYQELASKVESLIREMLNDRHIQVHTVTSRVKERNSLRDKIARPGKNYTRLTDVTDITGVRIITYFEDDVDKIAEYVENVFMIDWANSIDRRTALDPDRFGYLSLHHVAQFGSDRTELLEYRKFDGLKFELQTRSILQHAWAEMEHDLGYKTRASVPREVLRRFSSLAGLLEITDNEFRRLREELTDYEHRVSGQIESDPQDVKIDKASLTAFVEKSPLVAAIDQELVDAFPEYEYHDEVDAYVLETMVQRLKLLVRIRTIQELETRLEQYKALILAFAQKWEESERENTDSDQTMSYVMNKGDSLVWLPAVVAARERSIVDLQEYLETELETEDSSSRAQELAERTFEIFASLST